MSRKRVKRDVDPRIAKKNREAERLRAFSPAQTIDVGSDLTAFGIELQEAARRALD